MSYFNGKRIADGLGTHNKKTKPEAKHIPGCALSIVTCERDGCTCRCHPGTIKQHDSDKTTIKELEDKFQSARDAFNRKANEYEDQKATIKALVEIAKRYHDINHGNHCGECSDKDVIIKAQEVK